MTTVETSPSPAGTGRRGVSTLIWIAVSIVAAVCWGHRLGAGRGDLRRLASGRSVGVLRHRLPLLLGSSPTAC